MYHVISKKRTDMHRMYDDPHRVAVFFRGRVIEDFIVVRAFANGSTMLINIREHIKEHGNGITC